MHAAFRLSDDSNRTYATPQVNRDIHFRCQAPRASRFALAVPPMSARRHRCCLRATNPPVTPRLPLLFPGWRGQAVTPHGLTAIVPSPNRPRRRPEYPARRPHSRPCSAPSRHQYTADPRPPASMTAQRFALDGPATRPMDHPIPSSPRFTLSSECRMPNAEC